MKKRISLFGGILMLMVNSSKAQYEQLENLIDPFTGSVNYSEPLISIKGPNGEHYPVTLHYNRGGIQVEENASEVGLGWGITAGEITRNVNGMPDDYKDKGINFFEDSRSDGENYTRDFYGPLYFKDFYTVNHDDEMDVSVSERQLGENVYFGINYDDYVVNTPMLSGAMTLRLFEYGSLVNSKIPFGTFSYLYPLKAKSFTKDPVMFFKSARGVGINNSLQELQYKGSLYANLKPEDYTSGQHSYKGDLLSNGHVNTSRYVRYFTQAEIQLMKTNGTAGDYHFLECDYYRIHDRPVNDNIIGAIQVTTKDGMTYHFSLPEYVYAEKHYTFEIDASGNPVKLLSASALNNDDDKPHYAQKWLLTAVTGPDFIDKGVEGALDALDEGYYIKFTYGKTAVTEKSRYPFYGVKPDNKIPQSKLDVIQYEATNDNIQYRETGSFSFIENEKYYLSEVRTASEALLFCYGIRADEINPYVNSSGLKTVPRLKLDKIILIDNDDYSPVTGGNTALSFTGVHAHYDIVNYKLFSANFNVNIDAKVKQAVSFDYDYSLCRRYHRNSNLNVNTTESAVDDIWITRLTAINNLAATNTGKLTLKKVHRYEKGNVEFYDPLEFSYVANNPFYNPVRTDNWGFYKYNQSRLFGNYADDLSRDSADAWMLEKIFAPSGAQVELDYESNTFSRARYTGTVEDVDEVTPQRTFLVKDKSMITLLLKTSMELKR